MRIIVTGSHGQVARSLAERGSKRGLEIVALGRPILDLAGDAEAIIAAVEAATPDVIVSAAGYTAVDRAESERELAFAINERGAAAIARAARNLSVPLIHLSTDYVFDGSKPTPYAEEDVTGPTSVYGASKLAGEQAVLAEHDNCAILRTAWVYSPFGSNFVKTMLRLAVDRDRVRVVADQRGNPTSALDLADAILSLAANPPGSGDAVTQGVFHVAGSGEASWAEVAAEIFRTAGKAGGSAAAVEAITTADYPTPARRPANSRLDCSKLARVHGLHLPDWRISLAQVVERLLTTTQIERGLES